MTDPLRVSAPPREPDLSLADLALAELTRRVARANEAVATRQRTQAQLQPQLRTWAAIAAWFHADVRHLLVPEPGVYKSAHPEERPQGASRRAEAWIDFCPPHERADTALHRLATEVRRAYEAALARLTTLAAHPEEAGTAVSKDHPEEPLQAASRRAHNLARLDHHLTIAAGLPAYQPAPRAEAA